MSVVINVLRTEDAQAHTHNTHMLHAHKHTHTHTHTHQSRLKQFQETKHIASLKLILVYIELGYLNIYFLT